MIRRDIRKSHKIASLSPESLSLFCLIIPHLNAHGKMNGEPFFVKGEVCPLIPWLDVARIKKCLAEISEKTNLKWFEDDGMWYVHSLNWSDHQDLREDRMGEDELPDYSGINPGVLRPEVEVEVKKKEKGPNGLSDTEFLRSLETNPAYSGIDLIRELSKMDGWLLTRPGRKKTRRFIINWLNKVEKPIEDGRQKRVSQPFPSE